MGSAVEAALPATAEADDSVVAVAALDSVGSVALDWRAKELTGFVIACLLGLANRCLDSIVIELGLGSGED